MEVDKQRDNSDDKALRIKTLSALRITNLGNQLLRLRPSVSYEIHTYFIYFDPLKTMVTTQIIFLIFFYMFEHKKKKFPTSLHLYKGLKKNKQILKLVKLPFS